MSTSHTNEKITKVTAHSPTLLSVSEFQFHVACCSYLGEDLACLGVEGAQPHQPSLWAGPKGHTDS